MNRSRKLVIVCSLALSACGSRHSQWDDIDYSRIARENAARENDRGYTPPRPTVMGCTDDDLYNCNPSLLRR